MKIQYLIYSIIILLISSCNNGEIMKLNQQIERLEKDNSILKAETSRLNNNLDEVQDELKICNRKISAAEKQKNVKYAFVALEITELNEIDLILKSKEEATKRYFSCSQIKEFDQFNESDKYKFMDEFSTGFMMIPKLSTKRKILNRECYSFDSYEEASKRREDF